MTSKIRHSAKSTQSRVDRKIARIAMRYKRREEQAQTDAYKTPATCAAGQLRTDIYRLGQRLKKRGALPSLVSSSADIRPGLDQRAFSFLLNAVFEKVGPITKSIRNRIRLMARELQYAEERDVPPKFLIGFIHQVGGSKRIQQHYSANADASSHARGAQRKTSDAVIVDDKSRVNTNHRKSHFKRRTRGRAWTRRGKSSRIRNRGR